MSQVESRRALLLGALGGVTAAVAGALGRPAPAFAASSMMLDTTNTGTAQTGVTSPQTTGSSAVLAAYSTASTARIYSVYGQASSPNGYGLYAYNTGGGVGAYGRAEPNGVGVVGSCGAGEAVAFAGIGVAGHTTRAGGYGVYGLAQADGANGVTGIATKTGVGVLAQGQPTGTALRVEGKARFTRSGKASLAANKTSVDLDLGSLGGISSASLCFANLAIYKSGVWVTAVRPNWPTAGKMRIYINKVASTTSSTAISWLVLEG